MTLSQIINPPLVGQGTLSQLRQLPLGTLTYLMVTSQAYVQFWISSICICIQTENDMQDGSDLSTPEKDELCPPFVHDELGT